MCLQIWQNMPPSSPDKKNFTAHSWAFTCRLSTKTKVKNLHLLSVLQAFSYLSLKWLLKTSYEGKFMTQWSPGSRFSLPLLTLNTLSIAGVSCEWWQKSKGQGRGALQTANITTNCSLTWMKTLSLLLVILVWGWESEGHMTEKQPICGFDNIISS